MRVVQLQTGATGIGVGTVADVESLRVHARKFADYLTILIATSAGASVSIQIEVSADGTTYVPFGLAFTTVASGTAIAVPFVPFIRTNITAVTGVTVNTWAAL